jgi:hypothetical protein
MYVRKSKNILILKMSITSKWSNAFFFKWQVNLKNNLKLINSLIVNVIRLSKLETSKDLLNKR